MIADAFHHAVHRSMEEKKYVYTFYDFEECVSGALDYVKTIRMTADKCIDWKSFKYASKVKALTTRPKNLFEECATSQSNKMKFRSRIWNIIQN